MIYFWSDPHLGHGNIIRYCGRPFLQPGDLDNQGNWISQYIATQRIQHHDATLINNFNERVDENDTVFCLGDFCMKKSSEASDAPQNAFEYYKSQLKCKNIIFIKGNHDKNNSTKSIIESIVIEYGGSRIYMTHNPKFAKEDFKFNFCGHLHGQKGTFQKLGRKSIIVDLSVENWNYRPVDINEINQAYSQWLKEGQK